MAFCSLPSRCEAYELSLEHAKTCVLAVGAEKRNVVPFSRKSNLGVRSVERQRSDADTLNRVPQDDRAI